MTRYDSSRYNRPRKPICNGIWYYHCNICGKKYIISGSHKKCYQNWDPICMYLFKTNEEYIEHAKKRHKDLFCEICQQIIKLPDKRLDSSFSTKPRSVRSKELMKNHMSVFHKDHELSQDKTMFSKVN